MEASVIGSFMSLDEQSNTVHDPVQVLMCVFLRVPIQQNERKYFCMLDPIEGNFQGSWPILDHEIIPLEVLVEKPAKYLTRVPVYKRFLYKFSNKNL